MKRNTFLACTLLGAVGLFVACNDNSTTAPKPGMTPAKPVFAFDVPGNGLGRCMGDDGQDAQNLASVGTGSFKNWISGNLGTPPSYNCTSNDISIATAVLDSISPSGDPGTFTAIDPNVPITCTAGQTLHVKVTATLHNQAQQRYDIGIWIPDPSDLSAMNDTVGGNHQCRHYNLLPNVSGANEVDADNCGDMSQGAGVVTVPLDQLDVICHAGQANVTVNNCVAWANSDLTSVRGKCPAPLIPAQPGGTDLTGNTALGFRYGTVPENGAKCNCTPFALLVEVRGKITIVKNTIGGNGAFDFTHDVGTNSIPQVSSPFTITTVNNTGTQVIDQVKPGTYHVTESTPPSDFDFTSLTCTDNNAFASHTISGAQATITLGNGGDITCTYTNTRKTFLTLVKTVTNDNGGTKTLSDFPLTASGPVTISGVSGSTNVTSRVVTPGSYALTETTQAGYTPSSWTCSGGTQTGANIALATGNSATCTIINDDNGPTLTLVKVVTNNAGGTKTLSDFPLTASGPVTISGTSGGTAVTGRVVSAGNYALTEQTQAGYTPSSWSCSGGTQSGANIALALGGAATCTISNDDIAPTLTLVKVVTNNDGGTKTLSDFPLTASGPVTISGTSGTTSVTARAVNAGSYALTEQTQAGYTPSSWTCSGGTQTGSNIALALAGSATCTITNDDNPPSLTLVKVVTNNNGGTKTLSDFPLTASGPVTISGTSGTTSVTARQVSAGSYALTEQTQAGYTPSSWSCSGGTQSGANIAIALGGSATCTISNDDVGPTLTLVKVVTNNAGGTKTLSDFPLTASGPVTISGTSGATDVTGRVVNAGSYALTEQTQAGYTPSSWSCSGGTQSGSNIALALAGSATCTISNDDVAPTLTLVKVVTNNSGGTKTISDFPLTASGPVTISGVSGTTGVTGRAVNAGSYALTETTQTGYTPSSWSCSGGTQTGANIALALGGSATCTISNDDIGAGLTLVKIVTNNNGGTKTLSDFPLTATGPGALQVVACSGVSGTAGVTGCSVSAGSYALSEQTQAGYTPSSWSCTGGTQSGANIALGLGGSATCTISNDDIGPTLTLVKTVTNDNGGTKTLSDFPLTASGPVTISGVSGTTDVTTRIVNAGSYALTETTQAGYTPSSWTCSGGTQTGANIALALGGSATCTINNNDNPPSLTLVKVVTNNNGGTKTLSDFPLTASGPVTISGVSGSTDVTARPVSAGSYALTETTQAGYTPSSWSCSGGTQSGANIAIALGGSATCTISNDDNGPTLTLVKVVTNNNGGTKTLSDFPLTASGPVTISGTSGGTAVTGRVVNAGSYALTEQTQTGYTPSSWTCSGGTQSGANIALALGGAATCTISNDDIGPTLTLVKVVTNDNGGTKTISDFPLTASGPVTISGTSGATAVTGRVVSAGSYALTETTQTGYTPSSWSCSGGTQTGANIALALGGAATCTISNNDNPSFIIIDKISQGGVGTFTFSTTGFTMPNNNTLTTVTPAVAVSTGQISVSAFAALSVGEPSPPSGFQLMASSCVVNQGAATIVPTVVGGVNVSEAVTITQLGSIVECTFDNAVVSGVTRTQGFWATHTGLSNLIWNTLVPTVDKQLCTATITATSAPGTNQLMGGFWAGISKTSTKDSRSDLDQARMQALQQYLAAVINVAQFHSNTEAFLAAARVIYCGTDVSAIKGLVGTLGSYNQSGDAGVFDPGVSATSQESKKEANIPFWDVTIH